MQRSSREQILVRVFAALLLVTLGFYGSFFVLSRRSPPPKRLQSGKVELAQEERKAIIAKAMTLRDKWQVWAKKNTSLLQKLRSSNSNVSVAKEVLKQLPYIPTNEEAGFDIAFFNSEPCQFAWNGDSMHPKRLAYQPKTKEERRIVEGSILRQQRRLEEDFQKHRDVRVSCSVNVGYEEYTLWASGRITLTRASIPHDSSAMPVFEEKDELAPSYDFLR